MQKALDQLTAAFNDTWDSIAKALSGATQALRGVVDQEQARQRALDVVKNRHTGPPNNPYIRSATRNRRKP
jgi:hypothetical protein